MTPLESFVDQGWADHAEQPAAVADRLHEGLALVADDEGLTRLALLAHHVYGEHLGRWDEGLAYLGALGAVRGSGGSGGPGADAAATLSRCLASLQLSRSAAADPGPMRASDRCRVTVMAACNLAGRATPRASALLDDAVAQAAALPDADPAVRAVAAFANNIAGSLQETAPLAAPQRALMLHAAQIARSHWARAGGWREIERADYRLALCWLAAGDAAQALAHAQSCERIVRDHGAEPLELFFAAEALALPARALGDGAGLAAALATARSAFDALPADDQSWCRATLDKLDPA